MADLKLYWTVGSQPSRAVKSLLVAGNIPHEARDLNLFAGEHKSEEILKLNPTGAVPFIILNGKCVQESATILRYLSQKYPSLNKYYPADLEQRALIDEDLDFNATMLRPILKDSFAPKMFSLILQSPWTDYDTKKLAEAQGKQAGLFAALERTFESRGHKWRTGESITIADIQMYCEILDVDYMDNRKVIDAYPRIKAWMEECSKAAGIKEVHAPWAGEGGTLGVVNGLLNGNGYNSNMNAPKLHYFGIYGRAEPIRMAFALAGVAFEDNRYPMGPDEKLIALKGSGKLEFGQMPMLELHDGTCIAQGNPILQYLASTLCKNGLQQSDDAMALYHAECTLNVHVEDFAMKYVSPGMFKPAAEQAEFFAACLKDHMPKYLDIMENRAPVHGFLLGSKISMYDIQLCVFYANMYQKKENDTMLDFKAAVQAQVAAKPKFHAYIQRFLNGDLKAYLASRPECQF